MPRDSQSALRAELELTQLYLAAAYRERILEQRRRPVLVNAASQTEPDQGKQESSTQTEQPSRQVSPEITVKWPEHLPLVDLPPKSPSPDLRALLRPPPEIATAAPPSKRRPAPSPVKLQILSRKIAAKQTARPATRRALLLSPTKRKPTAPRLPGARPLPKITSIRVVESPLLVPARKTAARSPQARISPAAGETAPEPMVVESIDLSTTD